MEETIGGVSATSTYEYDKQGRLVEYTPGFPSGYGAIVYEYNNLGQKTSMTVPLGVADKAKKICYSYDTEGRLVGTHVLPTTATSSVSTASPSSGDLRFYYDDNGNRVKLINQDGDVYYFVYDPTASISAVLVEIEATGSSQYLNIREPDGSLVSRETYNDSGTMTCHRTYHFDGLGSVVALSNENGTLTDKYTYGEWGNVLTHTDPDTGDAIGKTLDNPYQYVGKYGYYTHHQQTDFKLLQLGVRYYDPETGRFTQKDPAKDGLNWYAYVGGNPLVMVDPSGLFSAYPGMGEENELMWCAQRDTWNAHRCLSRWYKWWVDRHPWSKKHPPKYGENMDKVAHCFVSCKCVKEGNSIDAIRMLGEMKEWYDQHIKHGDTGDEVANEEGISIGSRSSSNCLPDCLKWVQARYGTIPPRYRGPYDPSWEDEIW